MANWRYTCDIGQYFIDRQPGYAGIADYYDDDKFTRSRDAIIAELRKARDYPRSLPLQDLVRGLGMCDDADELNELLDSLCNWADANLVRLGV